MAAQTLLTIGKDKAERDYLESLYKGQVDHQSKMVNARREGLAEGLAEGRRESDDKWQGVVAGKDAEITGKDAENAAMRDEIVRLRAQLGTQQ